MDIYTLALIGFVVIGGGGLSLFWLMRSAAMYTLIIKKDYRNPEKMPYTIKAIPRKKTDVMRLYKGTLSLGPMEIVPYFNPNAYGYKKKINCVIGITGKKGDNNVVPIGETILSRASAELYAKKMSDNVANKIAEMNVPGLTSDKVAEVFTTDWVMKTFGVTNVEDKNVFMEHHKTQIGASKAITDSYKAGNLSWIAQNPLFLMFCMGVIVLAIAAYPIWQASANATATIDGTVVQQQSSAIGQALLNYLGNHSVSTLTPHPVTTSIPISNGTQVAH